MFNVCITFVIKRVNSAFQDERLLLLNLFTFKYCFTMNYLRWQAKTLFTATKLQRANQVVYNQTNCVRRDKGVSLMERPNSLACVKEAYWNILRLFTDQSFDYKIPKAFISIQYNNIAS